VAVQEVGIGDVLAQVAHHRPAHVRVPVTEEVRSDDPDVAARRTRHLPVAERGHGAPFLVLLRGAAPDPEHLFGERVELVGAADLLEGVEETLLADAGGVAVFAGAVDELARAV